MMFLPKTSKINVRHFLIAITIIGVHVVFFSNHGHAQNPSQPNGSIDIPPAHEVPGDPYMPVNKAARVVSPGYTYSSPGFFTTQVNVDEDGNNIIGDASNEPSITYDPNNPLKMAIGWRHFETISSNFRQAGIGYTEDGGETWIFDEIINEGIFRSDPVLDSDAEGNFFYNSLTLTDDDSYYCTVYKSIDGGDTWDEGTFAYGGDKQWFTIDKTDGEGAGNIYHHWTSYYSSCAPHNFTRSVNAGLSYEECVSIPDNLYWGTCTVNSEGTLYVCGTLGYYFGVAASSGAQNGSSPMSWDFIATVNLGGEANSFAFNSPNPAGLLGQVDIAVDSSGGPYHNNLYLLCSVQPFSSQDPLDVMFTSSPDGGLTWSDPVRVNDDEGEDAFQWFGTMSVASDGRIDVVWLDTRENPGEVDSKLYYAASWDAGETWSQNIPLGESFDPHVGWPQQNKMGDYFDMFSTAEGAHLAWANTVNGEQDVYYAFISPDITRIGEIASSSSARIESISPNPFNGETTISFSMDKQELVEVEVVDLTGRTVKQLLHEVRAQGSHRIRFNASGLEPGMYFCRLVAGNHTATKKMMVE